MRWGRNSTERVYHAQTTKNSSKNLLRKRKRNCFTYGRRHIYGKKGGCDNMLTRSDCQITNHFRKPFLSIKTLSAIYEGGKHQNIDGTLIESRPSITKQLKASTLTWSINWRVSSINYKHLRTYRITHLDRGRGWRHDARRIRRAVCTRETRRKSGWTLTTEKKINRRHLFLLLWRISTDWGVKRTRQK